MASIFKRSDGKHWFAAYRASDGRRMKVSTNTTEKKEAKRIADRFELEAREAREKRKAGTSLGGLNAVLQRAAQLAVAGRLDVAAARGLVNDILAAAGQGPLNVVTNRQCCDNWIASKAAEVGKKSNWKYEQVSREWLEYIGAKADKPLESITDTTAIAYRDKLVADGLAANTVNQTIKLLRGIYQRCVNVGDIGRNPFVMVRPVRKEEGEGRQPFSAEEVSKLLATAAGDWRGLILLAATTGLRLMDAARLTWDALDLSAQTMEVKTSKTGAELTLPIHSDLRKWLARQPRGIGKAPLFATLADKAGSGRSGLSHEFRELMKSAGITPGNAREKNKKGRSLSAKSFHSLRHFAATELAATGVRADVARQITGHLDAESHSGYVGSDMATLRKAVEGIHLSA